MKLKYFHKQLFSHFSVLFIAFFSISILFSQLAEEFVYQEKVDDLIGYGEKLLQDVRDNNQRRDLLFFAYNSFLQTEDVRFYFFDTGSEFLYSTGPYEKPGRLLSDEEWEKLKQGETISIQRDLTKFDQGMTIVAIPEMYDEQFQYGILLAAPSSSSTNVINQLTVYLIFSSILACCLAFLLSWLLSKNHEKRIRMLQDATSKIALGDYTVQVPLKGEDEIGNLGKDFNYMTKVLRESQEEINRLESRRRRFMADVSHELRTPLTTMSGIVEGLQNDLIPESEKEKSLRLVNKETKRLIRLVNENLDYERIRSNQIPIHKVSIDLGDLFELVVDQLELIAEEKDITLHVDLVNEVSAFADYDRLVQILMNITKNAIQFTEQGSVTLQGVETKRETIIKIKDTGIGMSAEEVHSIWERFYKADLSRTNNPYGEFGLGLSIVKQLVLLHEGTIEVESTPLKGTQFTITLPKQKNSSM
ncbi:sensor histidine kinase [Bacillus coahuilensis]|uniref:sensor histidine kinase n=1 Tax=Bacillus coahuilensis TaxID=408580 RepID=UPI0001850AB3|nr:HAMP domain-containing sensor histidine kinase [Bacillus coahuilensis]